MLRIVKLAIAASLAAGLAACAQPTAQTFEAPQRKQTDAKTQLESGRRF
jgi:curli biogenesis system outer membrane secretion channel CsgG